MKKGNNLLKSLRETLRHYLLSLLMVLIFQFFYYFIFSSKENVNYLKEGIFIVLYTLPWSLVSLPILFAAFISHFFIYRKFSIRRKGMISLVIYFGLGLLIPLFLIIIGAIYYPKDKEAGWILLFGLYSLVPFLILTITNYLFMLYRLRRKL